MNYHQIIVDLSQKHSIAICYECECRGFGKVMRHSRDHAHCKERKICLSSEPKGYVSFFTALHEMGHVVAENASYGDGVPRALAEYNATEWTYIQLRDLGIPIRRKEKKKYDAYITNKIGRGLRRGLQTVPKELRKYKATKESY